MCIFKGVNSDIICKSNLLRQNKPNKDLMDDFLRCFWLTPWTVFHHFPHSCCSLTSFTWTTHCASYYPSPGLLTPTICHHILLPVWQSYQPQGRQAKLLQWVAELLSHFCFPRKSDSTYWSKNCILGLLQWLIRFSGDLTRMNLCSQIWISNRKFGNFIKRISYK